MSHFNLLGTTGKLELSRRRGIHVSNKRITEVEFLYNPCQTAAAFTVATVSGVPHKARRRQTHRITGPDWRPLVFLVFLNQRRSLPYRAVVVEFRLSCKRMRFLPLCLLVSLHVQLTFLILWQ